MNRIGLIYIFLLLLSTFSFASIDVIEYYGDGCTHCARTTALLFELADEHNLTIEGKEVYFAPQNRREMFDLYIRFGMDPADPAKSGVPTSLVGNKSLVIGELSRERWIEIFDHCEKQGCQEGVFTQNSFSQIQEKNSGVQLTLAVLIGAAIVDSVNPCTIAVMIMLLGVILISKGRKQTLVAGLLFASTVFVMYLLMGLGLLQAISSVELQNAFFIFVTIAAFILAILEIRAYFNYMPGLLAVEMPMFFRKYAKGIMKGATSAPGVIIAAAACSLFLLPCSSGPYLMVLAMLSKAVTLQAISYLLLYNFIFILPMLIIAFAIYAGRVNTEEVHELKEKYIREIHLFSGMILFVLFLLMLGQLLHLI